MTEFNETVVERDGDSVTLELTPQAGWDYFDGHFPEFKLLPAVAQFEIVSRLADKYFHCGVLMAGAKRIKFSAVITPGLTVRLSLSLNRAKGTLSFEITGGGGEWACSSGVLYVRRD
jgi:3-hydroxymyristoyl/3-hydroxydecanoyl-(acyl carrier protein) dehydratase